MAKGSKSKGGNKFTIDCSAPANDGVVDTNDFAEYLRARVKYQKSKDAGKNVTIEAERAAITVSGPADFGKRQLKYLSKKYLAHEKLRDYLHVVASSKDSYTLKFFKLSEEDEE